VNNDVQIIPREQEVPHIEVGIINPLENSIYQNSSEEIESKLEAFSDDDNNESPVSIVRDHEENNNDDENQRLETSSLVDEREAEERSREDNG